MATNHDIINELRKSYAMELETVENYLANLIDRRSGPGIRRAFSRPTSRNCSITAQKSSCFHGE
jgi:hypothetical protein